MEDDANDSASLSSTPRCCPPTVGAVPHETPLLFDVLPTVAAALERSLAAEGERKLARSLRGARIHALCECGESDCMSFYLSDPRVRCRKYRVVLPSAVMTVGVCDGGIKWVQDEALHESDDETLERLREYQKLVGVVPRAPSTV